MHIKPSDITEKEVYKLLIGSILPRPIAFVSTIGEDGPNLAPFSYFTCVSTSPPMVAFSLQPGPYGPKDTLRHIRENGEFVVNIVSRSFIDKVNIAATDFAPGINEFEQAELTETPSLLVKPPGVAESLVNLECRKYTILELGKDTLVIGEVVSFHVNDDVLLERYRIDLDKLDPVGRLAGNLYSTCENRIEIKRIKKGGGL
jgi:flavin reductase (DIM6/NTAB) family NADH-FMN oxidoreductase RutF